MLTIKQGKHLGMLVSSIQFEGEDSESHIHLSVLKTLKSQEDLEGFIKGLPTTHIQSLIDGLEDGAEVYVYTSHSDWKGCPMRTAFGFNAKGQLCITEAKGEFDDLMACITTIEDLKAALATL